MKTLLQAIRHHAASRPDAVALKDGIGELSYGALQAELDLLTDTLPGQRIGLLMDNGIHWACLDLALLGRQALCVPMPTFFSDDQLRHLVRDAGIDIVYTDQPARMAALDTGVHHACFRIAGHRLDAFAIPARINTPETIAGTTKITYTSGTTGQPKGVRLDADALQAVTDSLCEAVRADRSDRTLSLLPLSTLLENVAGLYAPLQAGAKACIPSLAECGFEGSSRLDIARLFQTLHRVAPTTLVLVPQILKALLGGITAGLATPDSLRFVAVGGAPMPGPLLQAARLFGLPVFQGYGLSEACSVACLNLPGQERDGSVGKPLPHARIRIADDGEVMVSGTLFHGYLGERGSAPGLEWATGDLGHIDADGYLFLTGRKKTVYATAFGRNIAPEWVESVLTSHPHIAQAAIYGEARPFNVAVLHGRPGISARELNDAVDSVNERLPDYARVGGWIQADQPFTHDNGLSTGTGGLRRDAIAHHYRSRIDLFYEESHAVL